ncbi:family 18 glycoside hydrolase [Melampsora americana]|nr:family 18 glycoside hydrolase [Melampsora americana]
MYLQIVLAVIFTLHLSVLGWADKGKPVVAGYYPSYHAHRQPPSDIPWSHYTHIDYFVVPVKDAANQLPIQDEQNLRETVKLAKANNVSISITLGGWSGSGAFSNLVSSSNSRDQFAASIVSLVKNFELDGVEIDWEFPGVTAAEGNAYSPADTSNFLALLTTLRQLLGAEYRLSAAVSILGFVGPDGQYLTDTRGFSEVLDYITIMAYDVYGSGTGNVIAGPNAPLFHTCSDPNHQYSVSSGVESWIKSGFNPRKILLGIPSYGYGYTLIDDSLKPTKLGTMNVTSLLYQQALPGGQGGKLAAGGGHWLFRELHTEEKLSKDLTQGIAGYQRHYDNCTHTPFLYHPETKHLITYEDPGSILEKSRFAKEHDLGGINVFDTTGDTPEARLLPAIHINYPSHRINV